MEAIVMAKMRRWTDAIAATDIAGVIPELTEFLSGDVTEKTTNKITFKLIQHLSHTAYRCDRSNAKFGVDLSRMTDLLCSKMTAAANSKKFFSSIYHIIACTLEMKLYRDAMEICNYLLPEYELCRADGTITELEIYEPTSNLWHKTAACLLKEVDFENSELCELFVSVVGYELKLTRLTSAEDASRAALTRILSHSKKIMLKSDTIYRERLKDSMLDYARSVAVTLTDDDKSDVTWQLICELIAAWIGRDINSTSVVTIVANYRRYFDVFRRSTMPNERYASSFTVWERLCDLSLRKIENIGHNWSNDIDVWSKAMDRVRRLVPRQVLKSYCYAVLQLLTSILNYWEDCVKRKEIENVRIEMIAGITRLSKKHAALYGTFEISECRCQALDCRVKTDVANEMILTIKCLSLIARRMGSFACEIVRNTTISMVRTSFKLLETLKAANCEQWNLFWPTWGATIYNMSVSCENTYPTESIELYSVLSTSIVTLVGVKTRTRLWSFDDPLGTILHRLSSVCLKDQRYARAKSVTSVNCLLSHNYPETKAYRDWANIKHKDKTEIEMTILQYLRTNESEIPNLCVDDYDLAEVCLREIKALQESQLDLSVSIMAVLDELERLNAKASQYARGVQMLGYHWLNFNTDLSIRRYLKKATLMYERAKSSCLNFRCAYAAIKFYEFVERTREITRNTENDMKSALLALTGRAKNTEVEGSTNEYDVVPAYSAINVKITSELESCLKQAFQRWREFADSYNRRDTSDWDIRFTLRNIKIAGEYSRLYHFESLENEAWSLTFKLANDISDSLSVVYATSRSLTSENFHQDWIAVTSRHVAKISNTNDIEVLEILARYRLCLANFYYENEDYARADDAYFRATCEPEIKFMQDFGNFLLAKDIEMNYRLGRDENDDQSRYTSIIIQCLYTLLSMDDSAETTIYGRKEKQLYDYEILLDYTNNLALRMNSLLSYREISAHLANRLGTAQKLVTSLRVAECLKYLCHIDLSRGKLDDCEVKLQGLEHILEIEAFDVTMKSELSPCSDYKEFSSNFIDSRQHVDAVRDVGQTGASPVLRKKVFAKPDFMLHGNLCSCFKCTNTHYQYLVFSATHVRAQLFALQRNSTVAFQHFHGAMAIKKCILVKQRANENTDTRRKFTSSCPQRQRQAIEYVMFHLDYCRFLKWSVPNLNNNEVRDIALDALELCEKYHLRNHPVYVSVNEFLFQCRFEKVFTKDDYSKFMVPDMSEMDVSRYDQVSSQDNAICVTPVRETIEKRPITLRRRKTPPFLKLDRVPIDLSADELTTTTTTTTPVAPTISSFPTMKSRRLRRKICDDADYSDDRNETPEISEKPSVPVIKISQSVPEIKISQPNDQDITARSTSKKKSVEKSYDVEQFGVLENSEVTKRLENLQLDAETRTRSRKKCQILNNVDNAQVPEIKITQTVSEIKISEPGDRDITARGTSKKKSVEKSDGAEEISIHENFEVTKRLENLQHGAETRTRSRKKGHVLNNAGSKKSSTKTSKKIDEVMELFNDMSMDKKKKANSLASRSTTKMQLFSDTETRLPSKKNSLSSSARSSDVATSSENEEAPHFGRRSSARLRKKGNDTEPNASMKNSERTIVTDSNSDDEDLVVDTRTRRRLYTTKEQSLSSTNKVTKNNCKRTTRSEEG